MSYRDEQDALRAKVDALETRVRRVEALERRIIELQEDNARLRAELAGVESTASPEVPSSDIYIDARVVEYIERLLDLSRSPAELAGFADAVLSAPLANAEEVVAAVKEHAVSGGKTYVTPEDVKAVVRALLVDGVLLTEGAIGKGVTTAAYADAVLAHVEVP